MKEKINRKIRNTIDFINSGFLKFFHNRSENDFKGYINLEVPYVAAQPGDCGVGCVNMVISYKNGISLKVQELVKKYKTTQYYMDQVGWKHNGLVSILKDYGVNASRAEKQTISSITGSLKLGQPVIVSVQVPEINNLADQGTYLPKDHTLMPTGHLCVVVGVQDLKLLLHDPRNIGKYKNNLIIQYHEFQRIFTGRCIYIK